MSNESAKEMQVQLSDGRKMLLEDLVKDYERLLNKENPQKSIISKLKVGEWFRIDRDVIDKKKEEIHHKCIEAGAEKLWKRFEESNKIADENPDQYPRIIEVYIFKHNWMYKTEQEMRDMCEAVGKGMCDEIICDFELQMRICNGEPVNDLFRKVDKLPRVRVIKLRNGGTGYYGGGADSNYDCPPAVLYRYDFNPFYGDYRSTPYAYR